MITTSHPRPYDAAIEIASARAESAEFDPYADRFDDDKPDSSMDEPSDLDDADFPCTDDDRWDVFLPDDDPYDPWPEPGDFWIDAEE
jgi:hypothetical protein